jgi:hypothetical protein
MKKILILLCCISCVSLFAGSNWLEQVTDTVNTVNNMVNQEQAVKISLKDLEKSSAKYINKTVQVTGKVIGLAIANNNNYAVFIEKDKAKMKVLTKIKPTCRLLDEVVVIGIYNATEIQDANIKEQQS